MTIDLTQMGLSDIIFLITIVTSIIGASFGGSKYLKLRQFSKEVSELLYKIQDAISDKKLDTKEIDEITKEVVDIIDLFKKDKNLK